jgi:tRNA (cmo5U34)-methyltransferase
VEHDSLTVVGQKDDLETALAPEDGKWAFDERVTAAFDDMLERSIPQYHVMRKAVTDLASRHVPRGKARGGKVVDLGASRGEAVAALINRFGAHASYHLVEVSEPMRAALQARFTEELGVHLHATDLRYGYPAVGPADVTLCVLTLMFTPIQYRQRILRRVFEHTKPGGALILVEKILGATADLDEAMVDLYYDLKGENGYSPEAIERKKLSLEGVQVPVTAAWNEDLLRQAGFAEVDCFWRWCNFGGWIAVRA